MKTGEAAPRLRLRVTYRVSLVMHLDVDLDVRIGSETAVPACRRRDRSASKSGPPAETALQATARAADAPRMPHPGRANSASDSFPWSELPCKILKIRSLRLRAANPGTRATDRGEAATSAQTRLVDSEQAADRRTNARSRDVQSGHR